MFIKHDLHAQGYKVKYGNNEERNEDVKGKKDVKWDP